MSKVGQKTLLIGLMIFSLLGFIGYEFVVKWHVKLLPMKSISHPIKYVRVEGVFQYLSKNEVQAVVQPLVMSGFFEVDIQEIQATVASLPWVDSVNVKRIWPDAIDIKVFEKKPFARWGENSLITERGTIFTPPQIEAFVNMTLVHGPDMQQIKLLEIMKGIRLALADQSMELSEFYINDRDAWKIKLSNNLEILLGRNEQLKKLQKFLRTLEVLKQEQIEQMVLVDLRYPNGYAVSWKTGSLEIDWKSIANPNNQ